MEKDMKKQIAEASRELLFEDQVKKLTVKAIVDKCKITRQAFYYHFEDIPDLLKWILDQASSQLEKEIFEQEDEEKVLKRCFLIALESKVDQFHHYMVCYKNADQNELKEQLDSLNRVILEEDQQLKQKLHYSKSEVAFRIGMAYEEVENIIRDLKKDLKRMSEASSLDEFDAEKAALLAEYMMDFAMQTSDYALLSVMKANDAQLRLEEKEA